MNCFSQWGLTLRGLRVGFSRKVIGLAALMALLALTGCHRQPYAIEEQQLPYKVVNASDPTIMALQTRLHKLGVRVIFEGQDYLISIPSNLLFANESPRLLWGSYTLLDDIACYLRQFRKISVHVTAFSSKCVSVRREHALTWARARAVGDYLWSQGIDSRFIFTQGLASDKPIVTFAEKSGDQSPNSRVEIIFREAIA